MADQHSIAEARQNLAALVHRLEKQQVIEITRRGKPVAVLMSVQEYQRLSAERGGFWKVYTDYIKDVNLTDLNIEPQVFEGVRAPEPGRSVNL
ncbi:MAG TPA: type II toxin-antitoxin system Phd/YefM family antitoxin [Anaerolineales bacterium]|nr:type II toxin-antitoxin system Phd/YefM family antitoxin [Anaerolineales bacterium]